MPPPRHILDDGEDLPDKFVLKSPLPESITVSPVEHAPANTEGSSTLIVVAPKLSTLFDKINAHVTQIASIQIKFAQAATPSNVDQDQNDDDDQTKRYFDYDAPDAPPGSDVSIKARSLLEIPVFRTTPGSILVRLPNLAPSVAHRLAASLVNLLVTESSLGSISDVLILAPAEMNIDSPSIASLSTTGATIAFDDVPALQPPHCIQGTPASLLTACENNNISATTLVVRAEGPLGHELVDRDALPSLGALLNAKFGLKLVTKDLSRGSGMYI